MPSGPDQGRLAEELPEWAWNALVVVTYTPVGIGAVAWIVWVEGEDDLAGRLLGADPLRAVVLGAAAGLAVVYLSRLAGRVSAIARRMERALAATIGPVTTLTCVNVALFSATAEELLFRGILQPHLGIPLASILFAAVHVPIDRDLLPWPAFALAAGLLFAWLAEMGGLPAPIAAHFVINLLNLRWLARSRAAGLADPGSPS